MMSAAKWNSFDPFLNRHNELEALIPKQEAAETITMSAVFVSAAFSVAY